MNLICYLSNGYPSISESVKMADHYFDGGCDIIEIDFPSRNPYLDNEFIQQRMKTALETCNNYSRYMEGLREIRKNHPSGRFIILIYEETLEEIGENDFVDFCLQNNFADVIYIGSSNIPLRQKCMERGLKISTYVPFHLPEADVQMARQANGFIYLQSKSAGKVHPVYTTLEKGINYLRQECRIAPERPIYCGVGVGTPEDVAMIKRSGGDGAFIGSAVLKLQDNIPVMKHFIHKLKQATL